MSRARSVSQLVGANTALGNTVITGTANVSGAVAFSNTLSVASNTLLGTTTTTNNLRLNQKLAVVTTGSGIYGGASLTSYPGTVNVSSIIDLQRSRGTTDGSMTAVASGDILGYGPVFRGADGTSFVDAAYIQGAVDGTVSTGVVPGRLTFNTSNTSGGNQEVMRIDSSGRATLPYQPGFAYIGAAIGYASTYLIFSSGTYNYNIGNMFNPTGGTSGASRVTVPISGYYYIGASIMGYTDGSRIEIFLRRNGSNMIGVNSVSSQYNNANMNGIFYLAANDYFEIHKQEGTLYTGNSNFDIFLTVRLLG
jgi:hypothetical protein